MNKVVVFFVRKKFLVALHRITVEYHVDYFNDVLDVNRGNSLGQKLSAFIEHILICVPEMNEGLVKDTRVSN